MTDNTQPLALMLAEQYDYGDPAAHSNTWKVAVCTELRRQHARIAELKARVQELGAMARENRSRRIVELEAQLEALRAALAASPTTPAEQQATKETSGGFHVWRDISTAPKDGSRFVATGHNYGLYSEVRHTCVAQWFRGCWMEVSDWNETSELKYLTHWMPLPSPPDDVAAPAEKQAAPKAAPGEQNTVTAEWLEQAYREGWEACRDAETIGEEAEDWAFGNSTANSRMIDAQQAAPQQEAQPTEIPQVIERMATDRYKVVPSHESMFHRWAVVAGSGTQQLYLGREVECQNMARKFAGAFLDGAFFAMQQPAPQQEAQEPALFVSAKQLADLVDPSHATGGSYLPARKTRAGLFTQPLYTAPQPAPAAAAGPSLQHLHDLLYTAQRTTGDAQAQAIAEARSWPKVSGVSRDEGHSRALLVFFAAEPTDDEVRAVHDTLAAQPAPLSDDAKDAARYRWLREGNDAKHGAAWHVAVNLYGCEWDAAIDAALAAQKGKL